MGLLMGLLMNSGDSMYCLMAGRACVHITHVHVNGGEGVSDKSRAVYTSMDISHIPQNGHRIPVHKQKVKHSHNDCIHNLNTCSSLCITYN